MFRMKTFVTALFVVAALAASVTNGRGQMPAFRRKLSRQDIASAVAHVRTLRR